MKPDVKQQHMKVKQKPNLTCTIEGVWIDAIKLIAKNMTMVEMKEMRRLENYKKGFNQE